MPLIEGILQVPGLEAALLAQLYRPGWASLMPHERDLLVRLVLAAFVVAFVLNRLRLPRSLDPDPVAAVVPTLGPTAAWIHYALGYLAGGALNKLGLTKAEAWQLLRGAA